MAIRFTPEYNARIKRTVVNYNQRVRRANKEAKIRKSELPGIASIKTLKKSYTNRRDLERELRNLELFRRKSARHYDKVISDYDINMISRNRRKAIEHYRFLADIAKSRIKHGYPSEKADLFHYENIIRNLSQDISKSSDAELRAMKGNVEDYRKSFERQATGYRGFLSEVEMIMDRVGINRTDKEIFFDKLSQLNSEEFFEAYKKSDLVSKIYDLADSPKYTRGKLVLYSTEKDARELIDTLLEEIDVIIKDVKTS